VGGIDLERWWAALAGTVAAVPPGRGCLRDIAGVGLDGIGWSLVPVAAAFRPHSPALPWLARRAAAAAAELRAGAGADRLVDLAANPLDAAYITPKLLWLRRRRPAVFAAARWFLTASGFLTARLTGQATCDFTQAYGFHCFDIRRGRWDEEAAEALGIARPAAAAHGGRSRRRDATAPGAPGWRRTPVLVGARRRGRGARRRRTRRARRRTRAGE
jgi:xylulokinase